MSATFKRLLLSLLCGCLCLQLYGCGRDLLNQASEGTDNIPRNTREESAFTVVNGRVQYPGALLGIDVSAHQNEINWEAVREDGVSFAIIRVGYRGNTKGGLMMDDYFTENMKGALDAGLEVGVYFFSQATSQAEAVEEAEFLLAAIEGYSLSYPVFYDWEQAPEGRTAEVKLLDVTQYAKAFCQTVAAAGYEPGVYFNQLYGYSMRLDQLTDYAFWLAEYNDHMSYTYDAQYWQFSCTGAVAGIQTAVDLNLYYPSEELRDEVD